MAAAARGVAPQPKPAPVLPRRPAAPPIKPESRRPLPYAEPVGINDNLDQPRSEFPARRERRRLSIVRLIAWIVILPWYILVAAASVGVAFLFVKGLFGF